MSIFRPRSLKSLLMLHESAFVLLVIVTGAVGGMWAFFWQQSSEESLRINSLLFEAQQIRGDLYRQLKEVTRARLMEDPTALDQYWHHLYRIDRLFYQLQQSTANQDEKTAVNTMRQSYEMMQTEMNKIFDDPYQISEAVRMKIIDPAYEEWILGDFEMSFGEFISLIAQRRQSLEDKLAYWTRLAPIIIAIPIVLAAGLLFYSHQKLKRDFVRPMSDITSGAAKIARGILEHKIPTRGVIEVVQLSRSINNMAKDLTASRDALVESERQAALGNLVPVVAHNIRNPLASIRAASQMIDLADTPSDLHEVKEGIIDTVDRLERWVRSLLSYLNPLKPNKHVADLKDIIEGALAPLAPKLAEKNVHIVRKNWHDKASLHADVDLLEQAIYGLLNNAVEASPPDTEIILTLEFDNSGTGLVIEDQGSGMPFSPQPTNLSPGPTTKRFGTGLGIPFAFKICQAHGGKLRFESGASGGTRVRLSFPVNKLA